MWNTPFARDVIIVSVFISEFNVYSHTAKNPLWTECTFLNKSYWQTKNISTVSYKPWFLLITYFISFITKCQLFKNRIMWRHGHSGVIMDPGSKMETRTSYTEAYFTPTRPEVKCGMCCFARNKNNWSFLFLKCASQMFHWAKHTFLPLEHLTFSHLSFRCFAIIIWSVKNPVFSFLPPLLNSRFSHQEGTSSKTYHPGVQVKNLWSDIILNKLPHRVIC